MPKRNRLIKAIILAGGDSRRMNLELPKQLAKIDNRPLLAYTLDIFESSPFINGIILVVNKKFTIQFRNLIKKYRYRKIEQLVLGGATRRQSVFNALKRIENCAYVVIHDGVRPFVTPQIIARTIRAVKKFGAVTCAVQAKDTMAEAKKYSIDSVLYRNMIWHLQTPQAFKLNLIYQAHRIANSRKNFDPSDDTQLLLMLNQRVKIVEGSYENIKVTTHFDFDLVKLILQHRNKSQEK